MSLLTMTANYSDEKKPPKPEAILKLATSTLKLIRAVEKSKAKERGEKYEPIPWTVRIFMFSDRAVAEFDAPGYRPKEITDIMDGVAASKLPDVRGVA